MECLECLELFKSFLLQLLRLRLLLRGALNARSCTRLWRGGKCELTLALTLKADRTVLGSVVIATSASATGAYLCEDLGYFLALGLEPRSLFQGGRALSHNRYRIEITSKVVKPFKITFCLHADAFLDVVLVLAAG
ncbi:hypothetical protein AYO08_09730 [Pseudomonas putida]|nr:hypothetical protein AYO08_09730 [Pseudomonas putida]